MISIIVPIYNCRDYIKKTIDSIKKQTLNDFEVLLVNDKSNDGSVSVIKDLIKDDARFKLISLDKNSGAAVARNIGIENAKGQYIAFLDSDDVWHEDKLDKQICFMKENDYDFTFTSYLKVCDFKEFKKPIAKAKKKLCYRDLLKANFIGCSTAIYNQETLGKTYMPLMRKRQDYGLWLALLKKTKYAYGLNEVLTTYTVRNDSISSNKLKLIKYNWYLFRYVEEFSLLKSIFCLGCNIIYKLFIKN